MGFLTGEDYKEWVDAFMDAFGDSGSLATVVRSTQMRTLDQVAGPGALKDVIPRLIQEADDAGWAAQLARTALAAREHNLRLQRVVDRIEIRDALADPNPYLAIRMLGQPMLDREGLRLTVETIESDTAPRVFVVEGEKSSGKSYTIQFLTFIALKRKAFQVIPVDLERHFKAAQEPIRADRIAQSIINALGLSAADLATMPVLAEEQEARYVLDFSEWVTGVMGRQDNRYCLVFDHFTKALLRQSTEDMIIELCRSAYQATNLVVVLLEYEKVADLESTVGRIVDSQRIPKIDPTIMRRDLTKFFTAVYSERQALDEQISTDGIKGRAVAATQNVLAQLKEGQDRLLQLRMAVARELRRVDVLPAVQDGPGE